METFYLAIAVLVGICVAVLGWKVGYHHVKMRVWAILLFMIIGTPLSVFTYMDGARKAKDEGKTPPTSKIKNFFVSGFDIKKTAITVSVICGIVVVLSLIFIPVITDSEIKKAKENSKAFYTDGSINKNYTAYLVEGIAYDNLNKKDANYYFIFQFVGGEIRCYIVSQNNKSKARVLDYFNNVCEEKPSPALVLGAGFYIDIFLCIVAIVTTVGLWGWLFYLNQKNKLKKIIISGKTIPNTIVNGFSSENGKTREYEDNISSLEDKLLTLKNLYNKGLITEDEFKKQKFKIIEEEFNDSADNEKVEEQSENNDENNEKLENIGRVKVDPSAALTHGVPWPISGQDLPKLSESCEMRAPNESTESFCNRLHLRLLKYDGFGYSVDYPIGYYAVMGITRANEYFKSIIPDTGENWKLMAFYRIGSFKNCVDKYVVMYSGDVNGDFVGYAYELYLWMYDQNGFPSNLTGIYRVPQGFVPNPNEYKWADKTLYNKRQNLYGKPPAEKEDVKDDPKQQLEESRRRLEESWRRGGRKGTIFMNELVEKPEEKNNLLNKIPEAEGFYEVIVKKEDMDKIKFGEYKTVNGEPFCPVAGNKKIILKSPNELQTIFENNNSETLYIGKADNLRQRIKQLVNMAFGGTAHRGGIDLWAINDYEKYLQIEWSRLGDFTNGPAAVEKELLNEFKEKHNGNLPVANRK